MTTASGERTLNSRTPSAAATAATQTVEQLARSARPDSVFGQPIERGDVTVIPCCEIALGMGSGGGGASGPAPNTTEVAGGEGTGAGGGARGRPVAVIVISQGRVHVEPIVDATKVALAALTTGGFMAFWLARMAGTAQSRRMMQMQQMMRLMLLRRMMQRRRMRRMMRMFRLMRMRPAAPEARRLAMNRRASRRMASAR